MKYPSADEIINYNKVLLKEIKVKKADRADTIKPYAIVRVVESCKALEGDVYDKAICLIKGLIQQHPFASGNRRTAFRVAENFLETNNAKLDVDNGKKQAKVLQGIRESFYADKEIKEWMQGKPIREFERWK